jgi:hypothetical protein
VLIAGGEECCYPALSSAELYNSATGIFSLTGSMETGRVGLTATLLLNGTVLIAGGTNSGNNNPYLASAELYYPTAGAFTPAGNMTTARDGFTATLLASGAVLIAGGVNLTSAPNALSSAELYGATTAATPVFSVPAGTYNAVQTVGISDFTPGAAIYYTLDGSTPTTGSNLYSTPITVSSTQTLEAIAFASGLSASNVAAATYTIAPPAAAPVFSPSGGSYAEPQAVTLSTTASGASIHYTTDGSTPSDTAGTLYTGPITVLSSATIKAIAFGGVWSDSAVSTATYLIRPIAPAFSPSGGTFTLPQTVTLSTLTSGAAINYTTDGSTPSNTAGTLYSGPITVRATTTIKAIAYASGLPNSTVSSATYKIEPITPTFSPSGGTFTVAQTVTLSTLTSGAAINYTTDGSTPSNTAGTLYSGPITVSATTTIKAIAYAPGLTNSTVSTATYNIEPIAPALIPSGGTFTAPLTVMLSSATSGVFINYTTDGSTPSNTVGTLYAGPIAVNATTTIKAIAFGAGLTNSTVATATYKVEVLPPAFSPSGGTFTAPQVVTMICATSGASIRYTTDGSLPSDTVGTLYTGPIPISSTTTIKAIAFASGLTSSTVSTATYSVQVLAPAFSPPGGTFTAPQLLTMNSATSGASIRYTTDGSTPSETVGTLYAGPITLSSTTTIKAIAFVAGLTDSTVSTATFKIGD